MVIGSNGAGKSTLLNLVAGGAAWACLWQTGGQRQNLSLVMLHEGRLIGDWSAAEWS